jgi:hypothetical protein
VGTERAAPDSGKNRRRARIGETGVGICRRNYVRGRIVLQIRRRVTGSIIHNTRPAVDVGHLVAHPEESALLNVGIGSGRENRGNRRARPVDRVGEVQPLEAAVLEMLADGAGAADRITQGRVACVLLGGRIGRAKGLVGVAVVRERPVDAVRVRQDVTEHALGDAELGALRGDRALGIDEVIHERGEVVRVAEITIHRIRRVQDQEHVRVRAGVGLEELPVVRPRGRHHHEEHEGSHENAVALREPDQPFGTSAVSHRTSPYGKRAGSGPTSRSA